MFLLWWDELDLFDYLSMSVISQSGLKPADPQFKYLSSAGWFQYVDSGYFLSDVLWPYNHLLQSSCVWDVCLLGFCDDLG